MKSHDTYNADVRAIVAALIAKPYQTEPISVYHDDLHWEIVNTAEEVAAKMQDAREKRLHVRKELGLDRKENSDGI